jgi:hypothetical protein
MRTPAPIDILEPDIMPVRSLSLHPNRAPMPANPRVRMRLAREVTLSAVDEVALRRLGVPLEEDPLLRVLSFGALLPRDASFNLAV